jgi:uncharacterized protein (DUF4415 family)
MPKEDIRRFTLDELDALRERGEILVNHDAPEGPDLGDEFWANAVWVEPPSRKSVHLRIDQAVFDHFVAETGGKGHIARMQAVLKAYVETRKTSARLQPRT